MNVVVRSDHELRDHFKAVSYEFMMLTHALMDCAICELGPPEGIQSFSWFVFDAFLTHARALARFFLPRDGASEFFVMADDYFFPDGIFDVADFSDRLARLVWVVDSHVLNITTHRAGQPVQFGASLNEIAAWLCDLMVRFCTSVDPQKISQKHRDRVEEALQHIKNTKEVLADSLLGLR